MPSTTPVRATGAAIIDGLLWGHAWQDALSFSFPDSPDDYEAPYSASQEPSADGFQQVSVAQMQAIRHILEGTSPWVGGPTMRFGSVAAVTGLPFTDLGANDADLRFALTSARSDPAYGYYPHATPAGGDVWFHYAGDYGNPLPGSYAYATHIHEIGHALGLKHSFEPGGPAGAVVPSDRDSLEFTVMSYRSYPGGPTDRYTAEADGYPQTLMMLDILALQYLYGADFSTNPGDTRYQWSPLTGELSLNGLAQGTPAANRVFMTVWDGGGTDTYDLADYAGAVSLDLNPGQWSVTAAEQRADLNAYGDGGPVHAVGTVFNAQQYAGDARSLIENAIGGPGDDSLVGNGIANALVGGAGQDTIRAGDGNDLVFGWSGNDLLHGGAGDDRLTGDEGDDRIFGEDGRDSINGGSGDDLLAGWTDADQLGAGPGNDWLFGEPGDDTLWGEAGFDQLDGGSGDDILLGGEDADILRGDTGNDTLLGGAGRDQYVFGPGWGVDTVLDFEVGADSVALWGTGWSGLAEFAAHLEHDAPGGLTNLWLSPASVIRFAGLTPGQFAGTDFVLL